MHIAFSGVFQKPLVSFLVDKEDIGGSRFEDFEPNFIFNQHSNVYVLMRKYMTRSSGNNFMDTSESGPLTDVVFTTTVSSTPRNFDPTNPLNDYTYVSFSFSSFEVTTHHETVAYNWSDALAAIGGAACLARVFLVCAVPKHKADGSAKQQKASSTTIDESLLTPSSWDASDRVRSPRDASASNEPLSL